MDKQTEVLRLQAFATNFPKDSYLGPWLRAIVPEVQSLVSSDFIPHISLLEEEKRVRELRDMASALKAQVTAAEAEVSAFASQAHELRVDVNRYKTQLKDMATHISQIIE